MADPHTFDFRAHKQATVTEYLKRQAFYTDLAAVVKRILQESIKRRDIKVHSVEGRAKEPSSLARKCTLPVDGDATRPRYERPFEQITDLAAVRVITYFPSTLPAIDELIADEFKVVERSDKGAHHLMAGMGELFIERHPYAKQSGSGGYHLGILEKFRQRKIPVVNFDPIATTMASPDVSSSRPEGAVDSNSQIQSELDDLVDRVEDLQTGS